MIYLFDKDERLIRLVSRKAVKTALQTFALTTERYVSDRLTVEVKSFSDEELEKVEYMAIQSLEDSHQFHYFYVAQKQSADKLTTLIGVQSGIEELRKTPVYDKRPKNAFAREVVTDLLAGTNWSARFVGETLPRSTNFYYTSVFDALKKVCQVWDLEMQFFVQMNGNQIGARVIDFKKKIGQAVGKRVVYGHNALKILKEVERTNVYTALVGRGKGEQVSSAGEAGRQADGYGRKITFADVVWKRSAGNPVDKPKGQEYVEIPAMTAQYGIRQANGSMRSKIGFIDFGEEEDKNTLLQRTYEALVDASRPQAVFKTSSVYLKGVAIGDTIRVVRHDKRIDYDTRIFELTVNRLDNQSSDIKLGDRITESQSSRAQTIADKAVEEFVANEFSTFVQNLPDYLPSADGFNNNWYGAEDPTTAHKGKVVINDIWYKPDPEHEGHKIMLRWTGEAWEELVRTYDTEAVRRQVEAVQAKANQVAAEASQAGQKADQALTKAGASENLAQTAKDTADRAIRQAGDNLRTAQERASQLQADLDTAKRSITSQARDILNQAQAQSDLTRKVQTIEETANGTKSTVTELTKTVNANTGNLTSVTQRVATAENTLTNVRNQYSTLKTTVDDQTGKVTSLERQTADLSSGLDGVKERFGNLRVGAVNLFRLNPVVKGFYKGTTNNDIKHARYAYGPKIPVESGGRYLLQTWAKTINDFSWIGYNLLDADGNHIPGSYSSAYPASKSAYLKRSITTLPNAKYIQFSFSDDVFGDDPGLKIQLEKGTIPTDYHPAEEDLRQEFATYVRSATENTAQLERHIKTADGKAESAKTLAQQTARVLELKAEKSTLDSVTGRVSSAEATIRLQAEQIAQRLTSTQGDSLVSGKGYQTKDQVDANITGRGYITTAALAGYVPTTSFDNYKTETAQAIERGLTATKALIPTEVGGRNLVRGSAELKQGSRGWAEGHWRTSGSGGSVEYNVTLPSSPIKGVTKGVRISSTDSNQIGLCQDGQSLPPGTYTFSVWVLGSSGLTPHISGAYSQESGNPFSAGNKYANLTDSNWTLVTQTFTLTKQYANISLAYLMLAKPGTIYYAAPYIHASSLVGAWSPAPEDMVTSVDFNRVKETAQLYERVMGRSEGDIQTNVARQVMSSELYQTEVTKQQTDSELLSRMADGVPVIGNKNFATDLTGYNVYDNARTGQVTISRVADNLSPSGYAMMVRTGGSGTSPWLGGFRHEVTTAKNKEFLVRIVAKIPVGRKIYFHSNPLGTGSSWHWLSSVDGTGSYSTYVAYVKSGYDGNFSSFGFWAIGGGTTPTTSAPLVWYVSEYQIYDITNSRSEALTTRVTQLADSYAIQTLGSAGQVLSQINLATGGAIFQVGDNKLVVTPTTTYIQDGTIKSAMIESLDAGKITAGEFDAAKARIINLDVSSVNGLNAMFIKGQIENLLVEWLKGKMITASNEASAFDLNNGHILFFNDNARISRQTPGYATQFLNMTNFHYNGDPSKPVAGATLGVNKDRVYDSATASFTGLRSFRSVNDRDGINFNQLVGWQSDIVDKGYGTDMVGWRFKTRAQELVLQPLADTNAKRMGSTLYVGDIELYMANGQTVSLATILKAFEARLGTGYAMPGRGR